MNWQAHVQLLHIQYASNTCMNQKTKQTSSPFTLYVKAYNTHSFLQNITGIVPHLRRRGHERR